MHLSRCVYFRRVFVLCRKDTNGDVSLMSIMLPAPHRHAALKEWHLTVPERRLQRTVQDRTRQ